MGLFPYLLANILAQFLHSDVPLVEIHHNPAAFAGQMVTTCGDAHAGDDILYLRGWNSGRSRGGMRLSEDADVSGYLCVEARVVRLADASVTPAPGVVVIISHPPVVPKTWGLMVLRVLSVEPYPERP